MDNRWHNYSFPNNLLKASYVEWKYFNFSTDSISGIFVYLIADPNNLTGIGGGRVISQIFFGDKIAGGGQKIPMSSLTLSKKNADASFEKSSVSVIGKTYRIKGSGNGVKWDLSFRPLLPKIAGFSDLKLDFLNLENAYWLIQMPKAAVEGNIKIGKTLIPIRAIGYSDANWGDGVPLFTKINWAQYNDKKISIVVGETDHLEIGDKKIGRWAQINATFKKTKIVFSAEEFALKHIDWGKIPNTNLKIPKNTVVTAENKKFILNLKAATLNADPVGFKMPFSIPLRTVISEQTTEFNGFLYEKSGGSKKLLYKFTGKGFLEYTMRDVGFSNKNQKAGVLI